MADRCAHVGQLAGKVGGGGAACLLGFFDELGQQRLPVARLIEDAGDRAAAFGLDDLRNPVTYQLAVDNRHASNLVRPGVTGGGCAAGLADRVAASSGLVIAS